jgi:hypothetical protein
MVKIASKMYRLTGIRLALLRESLGPVRIVVDAPMLFRLDVYVALPAAFRVTPVDGSLLNGGENMCGLFVQINAWEPVGRKLFAPKPTSVR